MSTPDKAMKLKDGKILYDDLRQRVENLNTTTSAKANTADLAQVAFSGSYSNLSNTPTIPTKVSDLTDDSGHYTKPSGGIPASDLADTYLKESDYDVTMDGIDIYNEANPVDASHGNWDVYDDQQQTPWLTYFIPSSSSSSYQYGNTQVTTIIPGAHYVLNICRNKNATVHPYIIADENDMAIYIEPVRNYTGAGVEYVDYEFTVPANGTRLYWTKYGKNSVVTLTRKWDTVEQDAISELETNPTTNDHLAGDTFLYNGHLYEATAGISAGSVIKEGTNIKRTNVMQEINNAVETQNGIMLTPIYIGDYLCESTNVPSCCVKIGDYFYAFDAATTTRATSLQSNAGIIRKFDTVNNVEVVADVQTANIGHANSCAYDGTTVYVAPIWDFTSGTATPVSYLYTFDNTMTATGTETIPSPAMAVSFDPVTETLYYYTNAAPKQIYAKKNGTWTLVCTIDFTGIPVSDFTNDTFNQDFAVYNNMFYISSPNGAIVSGSLRDATPHIKSSYILYGQDSTARFMLGELEGFEFDNKGHLYTMMYSGLSTELLNGFVVELPVGTCKPNTPNSDKYEFHDGTLTLSEESQIRFYNPPASLRSLCQMEIRTMRYNSSAVSIPSGNNVVDDHQIRINDKIRVDFYGTLTVKSFDVYNGCLNLSAVVADDGSTSRLIFTSTTIPINLNRIGELQFTGQNTLRISTPNYSGSQLIGVAYDFNKTTVRNKPASAQSRTFVIGDSTPLESAALYVGSGKYYGASAQILRPTYVSNSYFTSANITSGGFDIYKMTNAMYIILTRLRVKSGTTMTAGTQATVGTLPAMGLTTNVSQVLTDGYGHFMRLGINSNKNLTIKALTDIPYGDDYFFYSTFAIPGM